MKAWVILFFCSLAWAAGGGSEVGNGGGLAEKNLTFAYLKLPSFIELCLDAPVCGLEPDEAALLKKIESALPAEQKKPGQLVFRSEKASPGFFVIGGLLRVAKTGDDVGDPIYFNSDLLYQPGAPGGRVRAMDIPLAVSTLVHELGHHQGIKDHAFLDRVGSRLQVLLLGDSQRAEFWNGGAALLTFQLNRVHADADKKKIRSIDEIVLENGSELYPLTEATVGKMNCPANAPARIHGVRFYNLHEERGVKMDEKTRILRKPAQVWYILSCKDGEESDHGDLELVLSFRKTADGRFSYLPELLSVRQESCKDVARVCK